ncbi:MAG: hypothetical protein DRJ55_04440 [Thermoprotei archaeon]|nr:MAG: hypothetical protein DRJ55_04440 [Thermoprotei archaeon]
MSEEVKWLIITIVVALVIGLGARSIVYFIANPLPDNYVEKYVVELAGGGYLTEEYTYVVGELGHHFLYRFWRSPLYAAGEGTGAHIELISVSCPAGSGPYLRDNDGEIHVLSQEVEDKYLRIWLKEAYYNEAGCLFPKGIEPGKYVVTFKYRIYPTMHCDQNYCFLELNLADKHIPYEHVTISIADSANLEAMEVLGDDAAWRGEGGTIIVDCWSPEDSALKLYLLYKGASYGLRESVESAQREYASKASWEVHLRRTLKLATDIVPLVVPLILIPAMYWLWGRETESPVVPKYLYFVPNRKLKPWQVNLLFKGSAGSLDMDAVSATIVDLARRGYLVVRGISDEDLEITVNPKQDLVGLDGYEKEVIELVNLLSRERGAWRPKETKGLVKSMSRTERRRLYRVLKRLLNYPARRLTGKYVSAPPVSVMGISIALFFLSFFLPILVDFESPLYYPWSISLFVIPMAVAAQLFVVSLAPVQIFGRWKPGRLKEKLEWEAFRNTLKDLAMIPKAQPQDVVVWKEWLAYGTALGVGDRVVAAMRLRGIIVPEAEAAVAVSSGLYTAYSASAPSSSSSAGGGGGGGGFGGGGAGVR